MPADYPFVQDQPLLSCGWMLQGDANDPGCASAWALSDDSPFADQVAWPDGGVWWTDLLGHPRPMNGSADVGAMERTTGCWSPHGTDGACQGCGTSEGATGMGGLLLMWWRRRRGETRRPA